jgi:hypothetical protein
MISKNAAAEKRRHRVGVHFLIKITSMKKIVLLTALFLAAFSNINIAEKMVTFKTEFAAPGETCAQIRAKIADNEAEKQEFQKQLAKAAAAKEKEYLLKEIKALNLANAKLRAQLKSMNC